ncbi:hypothetical protein D2E83_11405 [Mycobacteroides abscessus]|nr:hypothetical protein DDJ40_08390 [Mycobacteroides abscessus]RIU40369.1 hypothetical protein D2E83_11405 [Mycobacteroides abscessus]
MPKSLKDKHRDRLWWDADGGLWLFDSVDQRWYVLLEAFGGHDRVNEYPDEEWGPYRKAKAS